MELYKLHFTECCLYHLGIKRIVKDKIRIEKFLFAPTTYAKYAAAWNTRWSSRLVSYIFQDVSAIITFHCTDYRNPWGNARFSTLLVYSFFVCNEVFFSLFFASFRGLLLWLVFNYSAVVRKLTVRSRRRIMSVMYLMRLSKMDFLLSWLDST